MGPAELALRRRIMEAFASTGRPPPDVADDETLRSLEAQHVVVLDDTGVIRMAHPFAAHRDGTRVEAGGREWWGNCAWDGLGIVAALGLRRAAVTSDGITIAVRDGDPVGDAVFHVEVPAPEWWADIGYT